MLTNYGVLMMLLVLEVKRLHEWWDLINAEGPKCGYLTNPSNTWLITATQEQQQADVSHFGGQTLLGAALGTVGTFKRYD